MPCGRRSEGLIFVACDATPGLSVVVPVYNEQAALPAFIRRSSHWPDDVELVFSDGGSTDATRGILDDAERSGRCLLIVEGVRGRGAQCALGAKRASGSALMFMHVDEAVSPDALVHVREAVASGIGWGCLTLRWDCRSFVYCFGEWASNLRARLGGIPFADQCPFFSRAVYDAIGGMPDLPLMEDYELSLRLRAAGMRPVQLPDEVWASPRRFEKGGPIRVALQMRRLRKLYRSGVSADELLASYEDVR